MTKKAQILQGKRNGGEILYSHLDPGVLVFPSLSILLFQNLTKQKLKDWDFAETHALREVKNRFPNILPCEYLINFTYQQWI